MCRIVHLDPIEQRLREIKTGPALRQAVRSSKSRAIHQRLHQVITHIAKHRIPPESKLGKAIHQALCPWPQLELDLATGRVEIDNNIVKNYRRISIHSREYLEDVLIRPATNRGAREAASLTPAKWLAARAAKAALPAA